jgi:hypothetical protein
MIAICLVGCQEDSPTVLPAQDAAASKDTAGGQPDGIVDVLLPDLRAAVDVSIDLQSGPAIDSVVDVATADTSDLPTSLDGDRSPDAAIDGSGPPDASEDVPAKDAGADVAIGDLPVERRKSGEVVLDGTPSCVTGTQEICASPGNPLVGACRSGIRLCTSGAWGPCSEVLPAAGEQCNGIDDDCNGMVDEGCAAGCIVVCSRCALAAGTTADGSVERPFTTVEEAISVASPNDGGTQKRICVVGGATCRESSLYPMSGPLKMRDGLVIQGGYAITESGLEYCGVAALRPRTVLAFASSEGVVFDQDVTAGAELSTMVIELNPPATSELPAPTGTAVAVKGAKNVSLARVFVTDGFAANNTYGVAITSGGQATIIGSSISSGQGRASAVGVYVNGGTVAMRNNCDKIVDGRCASYCDDGGAMLGGHTYKAASIAESALQSSAVLVTGASSASLVGNMLCGGTSNLAEGQSPTTVGTLRCEGVGCTTVSGNNILGGSGLTALGIALVGASPLVDGNLIEGGCGDGSTTGVWLEGSSARLQNNLILGGQCPGTGTPLFCGLHLVSTGSNDNPDVHSNDIEPLGFSAGDCQSIGVMVERNPGGASAGTLRNNIVSAGTCTRGFAVSESPGASLQSLRNNDLYAPSVAGASNTVVLYRHDNTDATSAAQVNAISLAVGNISADPAYASYPRDLHLTESSPCVDQGAPAGAPTSDIDGNARPAGQGFDIGAYELPEAL